MCGVILMRRSGRPTATWLQRAGYGRIMKGICSHADVLTQSKKTPGMKKGVDTLTHN
jgi:hypothetical protein